VTTYPGRIEARLSVPTGGLSVSATVANGGSAATVTVPAANYYPTALLSTFQTKLNETVQGYPVTAAATAAAIGHGTWDAGWLFNITSGNDSGVFGGVTMTAVGSPTYGTAGPRGGVDLAVGFDSATDAFSAGDVYDATAADDIAYAWVAKFSAASSNFANFITKGNGDPDGRIALYTMADGRLIAETKLAGVQQSTAEIALPAYDTWLVGIFVIDRATGKMRFGVRTLAGTTVVSTETAQPATNLSSPDSLLIGRDNVADPTMAKVAAFYVAHGAGAATGLSANLSTALTNFANAVNAAWSVSLSSTTGLVSIGWTGYSTPTWSLSWTDTSMRDALGFAANISAVTTTQTGTLQCRGVWIPDWPLQLDGDPEQAPTISDLRTSQSPTGVVLGLSGNTFYRHTGLVYSHVARDRVWESAATYDHASWEWFFRETQLGLESSLFTPASPLQIYWNNAGTLTLLGDAANDGAGTDGWTITGLGSVEPRPSQANYTGLFRIELGTVVSEG
jgi:hypothetical protein